jgi:hypothetical protein
VRNANTSGIFLTMKRGTAHVMLAVDIDSDPISGLLSNGSGASRPFHGWIELAALIEAARSASSQHDADPREATIETLGSLPGAKGSEL